MNIDKAVEAAAEIIRSDARHFGRKMTAIGSRQAARAALTAALPHLAPDVGRVGYSDAAMLALARSAVSVGVTRSSFAQCAEWAHDEVTDPKDDEDEDEEDAA